MTPEEARKLLIDSGYQIAKEDRLANGTGSQIRLTTGQIVNVFDKGTFNVQGKDGDPVQSLLDGATGLSAAHPSATRNVFVVYGHDDDARTQLEAMLRRWDLNPMFLDQLTSEGQTLIEKLERYRGQAEFAVVLATPDDEGYRAGHAEEVAFRSRQNVVLELGMMLSVFGRPRVAILLKDQMKMERPSDIQGLIYIPFKDDVKEVALALAKEMNAQGLRIDLGKI